MLRLQRSVGNRAVSAMVQRSDTVTAAGGEHAAGLTDTAEVDVSLKEDAVLARAIFEDELAILDLWDTALEMFDKVLISESDIATKPNFQKVIVAFFSEKIMGAMIKKTGVSAAGDAFALLGKLTDEVKRAEAAQTSARVRDFFVSHKAAIVDLKSKLTLIKDDFETKVKLTADGASSGNQAKVDEYGMMRLHLVELFQDTEGRLRGSGWREFFEQLSQEWINASTVRGGMGTKFSARVIIKLNSDWSVQKGHIQGADGQKIAEQLLKNSPDGVDLYSMEVPRTLLYFGQDGDWWTASLSLSPTGAVENQGSMIEGNYAAVHEHVKKNGVPLVKKITGD
ncbi:MAG: hypothetical protein QOG56_1840 [Solirubrobacteraceae bacterium]|nr:hypothetical protein [Solirubrobacteraceae bacterium]